MKKNRLIASVLALASVFAFATGCAKPSETPAVESPETAVAESSAPEEPANAEDTSTPATTADADPTVLKVGASPAPHKEILDVVAEELLAQGIKLEVVEFTDYVIPNTALAEGQIDANFFQHEPYLLDFNEKNATDLIAAAYIHYEPFGVYAGKTASIEDLKDGAKIAVPNDTTNEARALLLLEANGLIKLKENIGLSATKIDIVENPKNVDIVEVEAAQVPRALQDVDIAVINGNYAIDAGLKVSDAIAAEKSDSVAAQTYANIIAIRKGDESREDIKALIQALQSDKVRTFIEEKYQGAVVAIF